MEIQAARALGGLTKAMPRTRLVSIVGIVETVSSKSEGELTVPELADALLEVFDVDMVIYDARGDGLAEPVTSGPFDDLSEYDTKVDILCDVYNSRFWACTDPTIERLQERDYMVLPEDGKAIAQRLWAFFFPGQTIEIDSAELGGTKPRSGAENCADYLNKDHPRYAPKLAAAVRAWMSVTEPNGKHPKQALTKWLREHAGECGLLDDTGKPNETGIEEVAKVANWRPSGGAPRTPGE